MKNLAERAYEIGNRTLKNRRTQLAKDVLEIIRHLINMNEIFFSSFSRRKKNYLLHNNIVQQIQIYFPEGTQPHSRAWRAMKCIPYSVKWKFRGGVSNLKVPSVGGMDIFWNYTIIDVFSILLTASVPLCTYFITEKDYFAFTIIKANYDGLYFM